MANDYIIKIFGKWSCETNENHVIFRLKMMILHFVIPTFHDFIISVDQNSFVRELFIFITYLWYKFGY